MRQRSSASDSNLRCREGEWFRLQRPWRLRGPLPIPFSAAAKENGSTCNGRGGYEVRVRFHSSLPRRRMVPPAERHYPTDASILDFEARLGNHCRFLPGNALQRAVILDFRPRVANRCGTIVAAVRNGFACGDRRGCDVPRPILFFVAAKENGPPTTVVAATKSAADSNLRCNEEEWFRLQRLWQQRVPHPILIFVAAEKNGPPAAWSWDAGRGRMPRRRHNPK